MTSAATRAGVVMGTAAYMSPEQAKGKPVDRRADIWSFGVVLFEMLVRKQIFEGETISDTLAAVIKDDPDWSLVPPDVPPAIVELARRCLEKDPRRRLQSIGEARIAIEDVLRPQASTTMAIPAAAQAVPSAATAPDAKGGPALLPWVASLLAVAILAGLVGRFLGPSAPEPRTRMFAMTPEGLEVEYPMAPTISPDGRHVAFFSGNRLWIRDLDVLEAVQVPDSDGASAPFWSPDGTSLAFGLASRLYRVPASGGKPNAVCDLPFNALDGGAWAEDDTLYLAPSSGAIYAVSALGGDPKPFIEPNAEVESDFHTPTVLPDGKSLLYTAHRNEGRDTIEVFTGGERKVVLRIERARLEYAMYSPTGHIVFHRRSTNPGVWAVPFSLDTMELTGKPFILDPDGSYPSLARDGSLLYALGAGSGLRQLVWADREGQVISTIGQPQPSMEFPELSPDGRSVLVAAREGDNREIWLHDVERGTRTRMTFGTEADWAAAWLPDGRGIAFTNGSASSNRTWLRPADGSGEPALMLEGFLPSMRAGVPMMAYSYFGMGTSEDLWYRPLEGEGEAKPFLQTDAEENASQLSPDGRYIIYHSDESGGLEVYLKTFPSGEGKWQVSVDGGAWPRWSRQGDEILYREGAGLSASLMSVKVDSTEPLRLGTPERLFSAADSPDLAVGQGYRAFDVGPGGDRFLMMQTVGTEGRDTARLVLSENWFEAYRKMKQ
jgi:Tol biopolymer transport system component